MARPPRIRSALRLADALRGGRPGRCPACEKYTVFVREGLRIRDQYRCTRYRSIPRWRALSLLLDLQFPDWPTMRIHEIAPGGAASARLRRRCARYSFFGVPGEPFEDIVDLSFDDGSIDLFVTQDVLEHVTRRDDALLEIARVLHTGGAHVFTVPVYQRPATLVRVDTGGNHLMPPEFHGGTEGPSLVVPE